MLIEYIKRLIFGDWESIKTYRGKWGIDRGNYIVDKFCLYDVQYSKSLNKYRVKYSGYEAKSHLLYKHIQNKITKLNTGVDFNL